MSPATATRRRLIRRLVDEGTVTSQRQLVERLAAAGHRVTQATVSRDLDALGAVKTRDREDARYEIPQEERFAFEQEERAVARAVVDFVESIDHSVNLVVVHTLPGAAHLVAGAIDGAEIGGVIGTLAGDDTVLVVAAEEVSGASLADVLERIGAG